MPTMHKHRRVRWALKEEVTASVSLNIARQSSIIVSTWFSLPSACSLTSSEMAFPDLRAYDSHFHIKVKEIPLVIFSSGAAFSLVLSIDCRVEMWQTRIDYATGHLILTPHMRLRQRPRSHVVKLIAFSKVVWKSSRNYYLKRLHTTEVQLSTESLDTKQKPWNFPLECSKKYFS